MLYEISLKFNTLKMYENTIEQMKANGRDNTDSFKKIVAEKEQTEKELKKLLDPNFTESDNPQGYRNNPKIEKENKFLEKAKKTGEYKGLYDIRKNFFADLKPLGDGKSQIIYRKAEVPEDKKPRLADIQEKISNYQWISSSNFIVKFPKDRVNIDEWRVSSFDYSLDKRMCRSASDCVAGELRIVVNDFSYVDENSNHVILSKIVEDMYKKTYSYILGNISVDVVDIAGNVLHTLLFTGCKFKDVNFGVFDYSMSDLRKVLLIFTFENVKTLTPNETAD